MRTTTCFMSHCWPRVFPALLLICAATLGTAAEAEAAVPAGWRLSLDNDAFAPGNHDTDYTGGASLAYSSDFPGTGPATGPANPPRISLDALIGLVDRATGMRNTTARPSYYASEAGLAAFTPDDIEITEPRHDDRPYASLLYFSSSRQTLSADERQAVTKTFTLGTLGLAPIANLQNAIHGQLDEGIAQGWDNQISAGGEPTLRYSLSQQTQHWKRRSSNGIDYDLSSTLKGNLGYLTDIGWGISGRIGRIASPWWTHSPLLEDYAERGSAHTSRGASRNQFYLWAGLFARARIYNALLQGQFRDSVVRYSRDELNPFIADGWLGLEYVFSGGIRLGYSWHAQTAEIKTGKASRNMTWGTISIAGNF